MKEYLLGIDLGTSGTKTVLFRSDGTAMAAHTVEYPLYQPQNGWAEQEPSDWWRAVRETVQAVLHKSGVAAADVAGVGISGQMHGLVMLDERGEVLHRSILWCDGRTGEECREITETVGAEKLIAITANPALAGFTAGKILWVRKHLPEVYKACRHILLPKDYIRYCLTGQFATEVSDASGMNLLDVPRRQWSDEILNKLDIDPALIDRALAVLQSLLRIIAGCALGIAAGSILGVLTAMSRVLYELFTPLLTVVRSTPVASFIILALVWIKRDNVAVFIAFLMVLPILWGNVSRGITECDRDLIEMAHIFRFSKKDMLKKIYLPSVRPYFFAGCSTALGLSWKAGVAAEVLSLPKHALGSELYYSKIYLETPTLFAVTLVVILLSVALEFVLRLILKKTAGWEK